MSGSLLFSLTMETVAAATSVRAHRLYDERLHDINRKCARVYPVTTMATLRIGAPPSKSVRTFLHQRHGAVVLVEASLPTGTRAGSEVSATTAATRDLRCDRAFSRRENVPARAADGSLARSRYEAGERGESAKKTDCLQTTSIYLANTSLAISFHCLPTNRDIRNNSSRWSTAMYCE